MKRPDLSFTSGPAEVLYMCTARGCHFAHRTDPESVRGCEKHPDAYMETMDEVSVLDRRRGPNDRLRS